MPGTSNNTQTPNPLPSQNFLIHDDSETQKKCPIDISFHNVSYQIEVSKNQQTFILPCRKQYETKTLLDDVSGVFKAGEVSAILGISGAGKTSLLNILACRIKNTSGTLKANGLEYDYNIFRDFANYVMQQDILMQTLTVRETLQFAADIKLVLKEKEKEQKIADLVRSMKLQKCFDTVVGGQLLKGISGGKKKRTSIAFQLMGNPPVVMLDEPTSGLDSLTSIIIVNHLSMLAKEKGRTIIMTIHQPSTEIFNKFDKLIIMTNGRLIYQGPSNRALEYFQEKLNKKCGQYQNPAQFFIQETYNLRMTNNPNHLVYAENYKHHLAPLVQKQIQSMNNSKHIQKKTVQIGQLQILATLLRRGLINIWRNPLIFQSMFLQAIFLGLFIGGICFNTGRSDYTNTLNWQSIAGLMFFYNLVILMTTLAPALVSPDQRLVFLREENGRLYNVFSYFLCRNIIELPYLTLMPMLFILVFYWMVGLASTPQQFFSFYLTVFLVGMCGNSLGVLISSICTDQKSVATAASLAMLPIILLSGYFKNTGNLPAWLGWLQYLSPFKYGFSNMLINETSNRASMIDQMNFDVGFWNGIAFLSGLVVAYKALSLFFLWWSRERIQ